MTRFWRRPIGLLVIASSLAAAQGDYAPDLPEPGSVEAIARFTSEPRFASPWVSYVPESTDVPSPFDHLGRIAGAAGEMARSAEIYEYLRALDRASERVRVEEIGRTEEGREILLVAIADEDGIRDLDSLKQATAALADPRRTSPEQAAAIIARARPIYYFNGAIHADESGSPEMLMELAYRLAVSELPFIRRIREELVVLINPVSNPDGRDKMADWFYRHLEGKTDYDTLPRQSPPYWGKYVFVDANRDAHQQALATSRAVQRMFFDYHPTVVHDLHEAIALLQTWNGTGPYNPHLDPIVLGEFLEMSFHEVTTLTALGMPGVWTWRFGEGFGHHYLDSVAMNHNAIGRGYETFGNATAETVERVLEESDITREWYRVWPPERRFTWSMRDNVNYQQTAALSILDFSAKQAEWLLRNFYRKGYRSWSKGREEKPFAYIIPEDQGDRRRVAGMVNRVLAQQIEVSRAVEEIRLAEGSFPPGTFVVRLDQPYRNYAVDLLSPQEFPPDAEHEPYDDVSWALPVHYGLEAVPIGDPAVRDVPLAPLTGPVRPEGRVGGAGPVFLLRDTGQEGLLAARYRLADIRVEIAEEAFRAGSREYPRGSWIFPPQDGLGARLEPVARELGLDFESAPALPAARRHEAPPPRIGLWVPWADTDASGWIRYTLDEQNVPYVYLRDEEIRAGRLRERVDVLLYGTVLMELEGQIHGIESQHGPLPFTRTADFPSHGVPVASEDITGGIGWRGMAHLQEFVEQGGVLVTLGNGSTLVLDTGFVRNVQRAAVEGISTPGAELRVKFTRPDHPIGYGYSEMTSAFRSNYPIYDVPRRWLVMSYCTSCLDGPYDPRHVVLQWGTGPLASEPPSGGEGESMVVSGGARGTEKLSGRPAILDLPLGKGRVVAFNFNPMHRTLNQSDHRFLWNAILNWSSLPPPVEN